MPRKENKDGTLPLSKLAFALTVKSKFTLQGRSGIYITAVLVGVAGALAAIVFQLLVSLLQGVLMGDFHSGVFEAFKKMDDLRRIIVPTIGGAAAGMVLVFIHRFIPTKNTEYMEAVALGNGYVPVRSSLLRSLSAICTIASGAAIGREGPLVQTCAVTASVIGRRLKLPVPRLRLIVACGAAAGMAAAFHTPLAGGLFVAEIVLGVITIDMLAPLLVSSCSGYLVVSLLSDNAPLYKTSKIVFEANLPNALYCILIGIVAALCAIAWLWILKKSRYYLNGKRIYLPLRLALAGLFLGLIAVKFPEIVGNGNNIIYGLVHMDFNASQLMVLLALKICAVAVFFGSGAVGGALTPSLTIGTVIGFLFAVFLHNLGVEGDFFIAFALIGMAAFFTTAAAAPMTSLLLVIEFTLAGQLIFPLIIGVLTSYAISRALKIKSMYSDSLSVGPVSIFSKKLGDLTLKDISRKWEQVVGNNAKFATIANLLIKNPSQPIFVASAKGRYLGTVIPDDVLNFSKNKDMCNAVLACDILRHDVPTLSPHEKLTDALQVFERESGIESLALVDPETGKIEGNVNKTDLYLILTEMLRRENIGCAG